MREVSGDVVVSTNKRIRQKRRKHFMRRLYVGCGAFIVLVVGFSYLSRIPAIRVEHVAVLGTEVLPADEIAGLLEQKISGRYLFLFPKNNIFFIGKHRTETLLRTAYPRIATMKISVADHVLTISLTERNASYLWCGAQPFGDIAGERPCYYFDETGFIFDRAPYFSAAVYFTLYDALADDAVALGGYLEHKEKIAPLLSFIASLQPLGIHAFALSLSDTEATLYLGTEKTPLAPSIIWKLDDDYNTIGTNLASALAIEPMKSDVLGGVKKLDYIDLRYEDKVYYKMKN